METRQSEKEILVLREGEDLEQRELANVLGGANVTSFECQCALSNCYKDNDDKEPPN